MFFGPHLMLDFFASPEHLNDTPFWETLLRDLVGEVGMTPLSPPFVYQSECRNEAWFPPFATGLSGFIVLAESHLAFHSFVEAEFVFLDVFSCKDFDEEVVKAFLAERLGANRFHRKLVHRGPNFPFTNVSELRTAIAGLIETHGAEAVRSELFPLKLEPT